MPYREREQYRPSQLVVHDGALHLIAMKRSVEPHFPWTSGMVATGVRPRLLAGIFALTGRWFVAARDRRDGMARRAAESSGHFP
ncbi:MAG TPA: hypothetical protein VHR97_06445, partial [Candidatus Baltobacteraceae bacterium]|nr:hypothetical protein [Candidatus Baltobacteraceae bacterium]